MATVNKTKSNTGKVPEEKKIESKPTPISTGEEATPTTAEVPEGNVNPSPAGESQGVTREEALSRCGDAKTPEKKNSLEEDFEEFLRDHGLVKVGNVTSMPFISAVYRIPGSSQDGRQCASTRETRDDGQGMKSPTVNQKCQINDMQPQIYGVLCDIHYLLKKMQAEQATVPMCGTIMESKPVKLKGRKPKLRKKDLKKIKKIVGRKVSGLCCDIDDIVEGYVAGLEESMAEETGAILTKLDWIADKIGAMSDSMNKMATAMEDPEDSDNTCCCGSFSFQLPQPDWTIEDWLQFQSNISQYILSNKCRCDSSNGCSGCGK